MSRLPTRLAVALLATLVVGGCAEPGPGDPAAGQPGQRELLVVAASSLTDAFEDVATGFEAGRPGVRVVLSFGPSSGVLAQLAEGAPAQVAALADEPTMARLVDEGLVAGEPEIVARNAMVVVTQPGNPRGLRDVRDLADLPGTVALCGAAVPCGRLAAEALAGAGVELGETQVTRARDARATLAAVSQGDADAAVVYATDASAAGDSVAVVPLPPEAATTTAYPVAVLDSGPGSGQDDTGAADARAFVDYVASDRGRQTLAEHGFLPP